MPPPYRYHDVEKLVRKIASDTERGITYSVHAERQMRQRKISRLDVTSILRRCVVDEIQEAGKLLVRGRDRDGTEVRIVVVPDAERKRLTVITAMN